MVLIFYKYAHRHHLQILGNLVSLSHNTLVRVKIFYMRCGWPSVVLCVLFAQIFPNNQGHGLFNQGIQHGIEGNRAKQVNLPSVICVFT